MACVVAALVMVLAFLALYPGTETMHAGLRETKYGPVQDTITIYDHGWPVAYAQRQIIWRPIDLSWPWDKIPAWMPWRNILTFSAWALVMDVVLWMLAIALAGTAAQWWRSHRRALWKPQISDLLVLLLIAGLAFGWIADQRSQYLRENAALAEHRRRISYSIDPEKSTRVPGFIPSALRDSYHRLFDRVTVFASKGDSDLASQFRHLVTLREVEPRATFRRDLTRMPQLEALDFRSIRLPYTDVTRQATILRELPSMPNLRAIDLYASNATDADMAWLSKCRRLEIIDLADSHVGDHGLLSLRELPRLMWLSIFSRDLTDRGCNTLAEFPALEELRIASRNIHDEGVRELARLTNLRVLNVSAAASENAFAELRQALPKCQITTRAY
jgi:hypothetical protein